jgi:cellulose synthase/poly-beta-1,6-N-acetylglucosamine synthase-like glycosyltransferase
MDFPPISVIVPIYNGEKDLPDLLDCLEKQTYPRDRVEYLLVNNNSSDRTQEILEKAAIERVSRGFPLIPLAENRIQSSYAARNQGIKNARHDFFIFTDADCRPDPRWLEEMVKPCSDPNVGLIVGEIIALPGNSLVEKYTARREILSPKFLLVHPFCPYGQTANLGIKKAALEKVGLFRPYLTTGGDADICWRIQRETNWKLVYTPSAIVSHRHRATIPDFQSQFRRYGRSNRYLHELHGCDLQKNFTTTDLSQSLRRWLLKEIPRDTLKLLLGKADLADLLGTPLDIVGARARNRGQAEAKLPDRAREIEWL